MAIKITKPNPKVDLSTIEHLEALIGEKLPDDYRGFLIAYNGGKPESNAFDLPKAKNGGGVNFFFGLLGIHKPGDLFYERESMFERIPEKVLAIGNAEGGNCICLSLRRDTSGQVFFWDHELEADENKPATFNNLFKVANSFSEFFAGLKQFNVDQVELKPEQVKKAWINPAFLKQQKEKDL